MTTLSQAGAPPTIPVLRSELTLSLLLPVAGLLLIVCLAVPLRIPLGGYYWDIDIYLNAAHRFTLSQWPHVDYFSPVGGLTLGLFAAGLHLFPHAQPVLLAQWSILAIVFPLMWALCHHVQGRPGGRRIAFALVVPLLVFAVLPFNVFEYADANTPDAFGVYNRQVGLLLYVLVAGIVWSDHRVLQALICAVALTVIPLVKITGLAPAAVFIAYGTLAGRVRLQTLVIAVACLVVTALALEFPFGFVSAYLADITAAVKESGGGSLLQHLITEGATELSLLIIIGAIIALRCPVDLRLILRAGPGARWRALIRSDVAWIIVFVVFGLVFESQNTGNADLIYVWPLFLAMLIRWSRETPRSSVAVAVLVAAVLPVLVGPVARVSRAVMKQAVAIPLPSSGLDNLGQVTVSRSDLALARGLAEHYPKFPTTYQDLVDQGITRNFGPFATTAFQAFYLLDVDAAVLAIREFEAKQGVHLASSFTLDFLDPLSRLLDSRPPRYVSLAMDPRRTFPPVTDSIMREVGSVDALIVPLCPALWDRQVIKAAFEPALRGRKTVKVNDCWELRIRDDLKLREER